LKGATLSARSLVQLRTVIRPAGPVAVSVRTGDANVLTILFTSLLATRKIQNPMYGDHADPQEANQVRSPSHATGFFN